MLYAYTIRKRNFPIFTEVIIMKKGLCIVLSAIVLAFSFAACGKKDAENTPTKIDEKGSAYVEVTDENGETATSVLSDKEKSKLDKKNESTTTQKADAAANAEEALSQVQKEYSGLENLGENDFKSDKSDLIQEGTSIKKTTLREDVVLKQFKDGKFTLKMKLKASSSEEMPMTVASDGNKLAADVTMKGASIRLLIQEDGVYAVLPSAKLYIKYTSDEIGGLEDLKNLANTNDSYVSSTKVKQDGVEYTCEEYKTEDGTTMKYYFAGNEWKRMETISGEDVAIYEIESLSSKVDNNLFSLKGYKDMTALIEAMAYSSTTAALK